MFIFISFPEDICKKKLKALKDKMRLIVAGLPKTRSGQPAFNESSHIKWPFWEQLQFMRDQFIGRDMVSNMDTACTDAEEDSFNWTIDTLDHEEIEVLNY